MYVFTIHLRMYINIYNTNNNNIYIYKIILYSYIMITIQGYQ